MGQVSGLCVLNKVGLEISRKSVMDKDTLLVFRSDPGSKLFQARPSIQVFAGSEMVYSVASKGRGTRV